MPTNRAVRAALLGKMGWSRQTLSANVKKKKHQTPMSTEEATYLLAHENGIVLDRFLERDEVVRVRTLHQQTHGSAQHAPSRTPAARLPKSAPAEIRFPGEFK